MLAPERAREMLRAFYLPEWRERRLSDAGRLPPVSRGVARALLDHALARPQPGGSGPLIQAMLEGVIGTLDELGPDDRLQLFDALFPQLADEVEHAWQLQLGLPYQVRTPASPFRAPGDASSTRPARGRWVATLLQAVEGYEQDMSWLAAWAPYLGAPGATDALGLLFAAAIDAGGRQGRAVYEILVASGRGEHEIGAWGRHVARGLLLAGRPDGWEYLERALLAPGPAAAQAGTGHRGLRRTILEKLGEAHPLAFRRFLRLILDRKLARFGLVARSLGRLFAWGWDAADADAVHQGLERVLTLLDDAEARTAALGSDRGQEVYLGLWTLACADAGEAASAAAGLTGDANVERRFAAVHLLAQLGLPRADEALVQALDDEDLRPAVRAAGALRACPSGTLGGADPFGRLERLIARLPPERTLLEPMVWPRLRWVADREAVAGLLLEALGDRPAKTLIPFLPALSSGGRLSALAMLEEAGRRAEVRRAFLSMLEDPSPQVRRRALEALFRGPLGKPEAMHLEHLLAGRAADLRSSLLGLLLGQADRQVLASVQRLLAAEEVPQRLAGLEILRSMVESGRSVARCRALAAQHQGQPEHREGEERLLAAILDEEHRAPAADGLLGLAGEGRRTLPAPPRAARNPSFLARRTALVTPAAITCLSSLEDLIYSQRAVPAPGQEPPGDGQETPADAAIEIPVPAPETPVQEDLARLPLADLWQAWWAERPDALRDADGLELVRALGRLLALREGVPQRPPWLREALAALYGRAGPRPLRYPQATEAILAWLLRLHPPAGATGFLLDAVEETFARVPKNELAGMGAGRPGSDWRDHRHLLSWLTLARQYRSWCPDQWEGQHHARLWRLLRWLDEPSPPAPRLRPQAGELLAALRVGQAGEADLYDHLIAPRPHGEVGFPDLASLSSRRPSPLAGDYPELRQAVARCRERILEIELDRGDLPTAASGPALALRYVGGLDTLVQLLQALSGTDLAHGRALEGTGRAAVLTHLIRATFPSEADSAVLFAAQVLTAGVSRRKRVRLALCAPQWAGHVELALGWPGLADAAWWYVAHALGAPPGVDQGPAGASREPGEELREGWLAEIRARATLPERQLLAGAADAAWFRRACLRLPEEQWTEVHRAAIYAGWGRGYGRARLFAEALLGRLDRAELIGRIRRRRHQDSVRALALLPLASGEEAGRDLLARYLVIRRFERTSAAFGPAREAGDSLAAAMAMQSLAALAGYPDEARLEQAMALGAAYPAAIPHPIARHGGSGGAA